MDPLTTFANQLTLKAPDLRVLRKDLADQYSPLSWALQDGLLALESRKRLLLPDLSAFNNETVAIFSDYAGDASGPYNTYSFLVCALGAQPTFARRMAELRTKHGLGDKEIGFKDFTYGPLQRALPEYLHTLDTLVPGILFTLVVDKRLNSVFGSMEVEERDAIVKVLSDNNYGRRKRKVAERLVRIVHTAAFLIGLLAQSGQKIFWMTDHDEICPSQDVHMQTLALFQSVLGLYVGSKTFPLVGGAVPFQERSLDFLDLLSAADITCSTIAHYFFRMDAEKHAHPALKPGADKVLSWLGHTGLSLKKASFLIRPDESGKISSATLEFVSKPPPGTRFVPIYVS